MKFLCSECWAVPSRILGMLQPTAFLLSASRSFIPWMWRLVLWQTLRRTPLQIFKMVSSVSSALVFCSINSSHLDFPELQSLFLLTLWRSWRSWGVCNRFFELPRHCHLAESQEDPRTYLACFPLSKDHRLMLPTAQCLNRVTLCILSSFLIVFSGRVILLALPWYFCFLLTIYIYMVIYI